MDKTDELLLIEIASLKQHIKMLQRSRESDKQAIANYRMVQEGLRIELDAERSFKGELRQTIHNLDQELHALKLCNHTNEAQIQLMRNCHNCNEQGCKEASDEKLGGECMDNDRKFWEHGQ